MNDNNDTSRLHTASTPSHTGHVISASPASSCLILMTLYKVGPNTPILQMRTLSPRNTELFLQGHKLAELECAPMPKGPYT